MVIHILRIWSIHSNCRHNIASSQTWIGRCRRRSSSLDAGGHICIIWWLLLLPRRIGSVFLFRRLNSVARCQCWFGRYVRTMSFARDMRREISVGSTNENLTNKISKTTYFHLHCTGKGDWIVAYITNRTHSTALIWCDTSWIRALDVLRVRSIRSTLGYIGVPSQICGRCCRRRRFAVVLRCTVQLMRLTIDMNVIIILRAADWNLWRLNSNWMLLQ